jgi:fructan beta-fructosidase
MGIFKKAMILCLFLTGLFVNSMEGQTVYHEMYRPQIHFSPKEKWMNDPNGMIYYKGIYHLFFQFHPGSTVWGPMHWGHATSQDLVHWVQQPVALFPDSLGYIFSGSAVLDAKNTSGFGKNGLVPLVAIFTQHDPNRRKAGRMDYENQSIAYSLDMGQTWTKYAQNPVLKNPGIPDFRDPKVMWYEPGNKWVMTLATKDRVSFYSSPDLKTWKKESEFGQEAGAHAGVWECPDLFSLEDQGKVIWVLLVNLNPGGPNNGSGTQYFLGSFDGNEFKPRDTKTRWLDYGPDDYAGVTWSNTGKRRIFIGWMSNWLYANQVPSVNWRNAMTIPRTLALKHSGNDLLVASAPVSELATIASTTDKTENVFVSKSLDLSQKIKRLSIPGLLHFGFDQLSDFSLVLSNETGQQLQIGYVQAENKFFIDRTLSGKVDFKKEFGARHTAPRLTDKKASDITLIFDNSSVELFADDGLTVMTEIFFPDHPYDRFYFQAPGEISITRLEYITLKGIWP